MPEEVNLSYDNQCNLSCPSCNKNEFNQISKETKDNYINDIQNMDSSIKVLFISGMGDPFATNHYKNFLLNFVVAP